MGLLCKILKLFFRFVAKAIKNSLLNDPYGNQTLIFLANAVTIFAWLFGFGCALYLLVWAVSLKILLYSLFIAYLAAFGWSKLCRRLAPNAQEIYLLLSTVGLTVLIGTAIQLNKMQSADAHTLFVYWTFLLFVGFILWGITLCNTSTSAGVEPIVFTGKIKPKQRFHTTINVSKEIPEPNRAQTYLKNLK